MSLNNKHWLHPHGKPHKKYEKRKSKNCKKSTYGPANKIKVEEKRAESVAHIQSAKNQKRIRPDGIICII